MRKALPYFEFNTSTNPFAYIRTEEDIDKFVMNIENEAKKRSINLNESANIFIKLVVIYLANECNPNDRNVTNIIKLLDTAKIREEHVLYSEVETIFGILLRDGKTPGLYNRYSCYKYNNLKTTEAHNKTIEKYINLFKTISEESLLPGLKNNIFPAQAILHAKETDYEVWFEASKESNICRSREYTDKPIMIQLPYFLTDPKQIQAINRYLYTDLPSINLTNFLNSNCQNILEEIINISSQEV